MIISKNQKRRSQLTSHMSIGEANWKKQNDLKSLADNGRRLNDKYTERTDGGSSNELNAVQPFDKRLNRQIPKINLEQKLTIKRSFYGQFGFLSRTLSSKSYTLKHQKPATPNAFKFDVEPDVNKANGTKLTQSNRADKINNNNAEQSNYNLSTEADHLNVQISNRNSSQINKATELTRTRFNNSHFDDDLDQKATDANSKQISLINDKRSVDEQPKTSDQVDYNESENDRHRLRSNERKSKDQSTEQSIEQSSEQLLLNKCNHCSNNCRALSVVRTSPDEQSNETQVRERDHNLNNKQTNLESNGTANQQLCLTNGDPDKKKESCSKCATRSSRNSKNSNQLNSRNLNGTVLNGTKQTSIVSNCDEYRVDRSSKQTDREQAESTDDPSKQLIANLSANESKLVIRNLASNLIADKSTNSTANQEPRMERRTPEKLSLNLVKTNSICSSTKSTKSVEIKDDLSISLSDQKSQKDNSSRQLDCSTDSPSKQSSTARSHFNYPRKLRNKLNASIHGSRSVRFHTKALFTTLTILGTYLVSTHDVELST